jgi:hypothetical protein
MSAYRSGGGGERFHAREALAALFRTRSVTPETRFPCIWLHNSTLAHLHTTSDADLIVSGFYVSSLDDRGGIDKGEDADKHNHKVVIELLLNQ